MCGIVGYLGNRNAKDVLINGLKRLEYRGYDSAGIATIESSKLITEYGADDYRIWKKTDTEKYAKFIRICIDNDINIVRNHADYIICLWDRNVFKGAGTHAEVTIAYELKKPVYFRIP